MYSSRDYLSRRQSPSPFRAPSKSANTTIAAATPPYAAFDPDTSSAAAALAATSSPDNYERRRRRQRSSRANHSPPQDIHDETWPLDEVINKIDIKSDSEDDFGAYNQQPPHQSRSHHREHRPRILDSPASWSASRRDNKNTTDIPVYSAFPSYNTNSSNNNKSSWNPSSGDHRKKDTTDTDSNWLRIDRSPIRSPIIFDNKWSKASSYDPNNNYLSDFENSFNYRWNGNDDDDDDDGDEDDGGGDDTMMPTLRDVGIQCNLKKHFAPSKPLEHVAAVMRTVPISHQKPPIKVIKSSTNGIVSAYSDVPKLDPMIESPPQQQQQPSSLDYSAQYSALDDFDSIGDSGGGDTMPTDAIYSQVDKSGKLRHATAAASPSSFSSINSKSQQETPQPSQPQQNINIVYKQPLNESIHSTTRSTTQPDGRSYDVKSKEYGFRVNNRASSPRVTLPNQYACGNLSVPNDTINRSVNRSTNGSYRDLRESTTLPICANEKEIIEETISISNISTDESCHGDSAAPVINRHHTPAPDNMSFSSKASTDQRYQRRESPASQHSNRYDHPSRPSSSVSKSTTTTAARHHSPFGTLEKNRVDPNKSKSKTTKLKNRNTESYNRSHEKENVLLANNSLRLKSSARKPNLSATERLYKSNADLRDQFLRDETRGGLAAAYKNRQQAQPLPPSSSSATHHYRQPRALSLNRMTTGSPSQRGDPRQQHHHANSRHETIPPIRYMSQTQLNGTSSRLSDSRTGSRHMTQHERDPIVMYIPPVGNRSNESPKLTGILRNNSTKSRDNSSSGTTATTTTSTLPSKGKAKAKELKTNQSKTSLKEAAQSTKAEKEKKKKSKQQQQQQQTTAADLNRRHSMPKDTKFNWFSKFKLKSNNNANASSK